MSFLAHSSRQQQSLLFDVADYFFDDDFAVPFDANLREDCASDLDDEKSGTEKERSRDNNAGSKFDENAVASTSFSNLLLGSSRLMEHSQSDSCLVKNEAYDMRDSLLESEYLQTSANISFLTDGPLFSPTHSISKSQEATDSEDLIHLSQSFNMDIKHALGSSHHLQDAYNIAFNRANKEECEESSKSNSCFSTWAQLAVSTKERIPLEHSNRLDLLHQTQKFETVYTSWEKMKEEKQLVRNNNNNVEIDCTNSKDYKVGSRKTLFDIYAANKHYTDPINALDGNGTVNKGRNQLTKLFQGEAPNRVRSSVMGRLRIPRVNKLEAKAFLSRTLPDLSFLSSTRWNSGTRQLLMDTSNPNYSNVTSSAVVATTVGGGAFIANKPSKIKARDRVRRTLGGGNSDSGFYSGSAGSTMIRRKSEPMLNRATKGDRVKNVANDSLCGDLENSLEISVHDVLDDVADCDVPEVLLCPNSSSNTQSNIKKSNSTLHMRSGGTKGQFLKPCLVSRNHSCGSRSDAGMVGLDRAVSMPTDINGSHLQEGFHDGDHTKEEGGLGKEAMDLTTGYAVGFRGKKSVSFSEKIQLLLESEATADGRETCRQGVFRPVPIGTRKAVNASLVKNDLKLIPHDPGLYDQDSLVAEFLLEEKPKVKEPISDIDLRFSAMIEDLSEFVGDILIIHSQQKGFPKKLLNEAQGDGGSLQDNGTSLLQQSTQEFITAFLSLIADGLLPSNKSLFLKRTSPGRLWSLVEESCRPTFHNRILTEAFQEVKCYSSLTADDVKFKAFVSVCLNNRALLMWLNHLLELDSMLKKFYTPDAFLRYCTTKSGCEHLQKVRCILQNLLNVRFNFDVLPELRLAASTALRSNKNKAGTATDAASGGVKQSKVPRRRVDYPSATVPSRPKGALPERKQHTTIVSTTTNNTSSTAMARKNAKSPYTNFRPAISNPSNKTSNDVRRTGSDRLGSRATGGHVSIHRATGATTTAATKTSIPAPLGRRS